MSNNDLKKLLKVTASSEVEQISAPLFNNLDISIFIYTKVFNNGTYWTLSNRADWVEYFYLNEYCNPDVNNFIIKPGYYIDLSELSIPDIQIKIARDKFNADHWFNIIKNHDSYYEVFGFAAPNHCRHVLNTYINNVDLLEHFILYFKDRAKNLILAANKNPIYPLTIPQTTIKNPKNIEEVRKKFLSETKINRYFLETETGNQYLTQREYECLSYIAKGKTFKETAAILGLTERTIGYYINNIKNRLGYFTKSHLINFFLKEYGSNF